MIALPDTWLLKKRNERMNQKKLFQTSTRCRKCQVIVEAALMRWRYMTPQWHRSIFLLCFPALSTPVSECDRESGGFICYGCVRWSFVRSNSNSIVLSDSVRVFPRSSPMEISHCSASTYIKRATTTTISSLTIMTENIIWKRWTEQKTNKLFMLSMAEKCNSGAAHHLLSQRTLRDWYTFDGSSIRNH